MKKYIRGKIKDTSLYISAESQKRNNFKILVEQDAVARFSSYADRKKI